MKCPCVDFGKTEPARGGKGFPIIPMTVSDRLEAACRDRWPAIGDRIDQRRDGEDILGTPDRRRAARASSRSPDRKTKLVESAPMKRAHERDPPAVDGRDHRAQGRDGLRDVVATVFSKSVMTTSPFEANVTERAVSRDGRNDEKDQQDLTGKPARKASIKETGEELSPAEWARFDAAVARLKAEREHGGPRQSELSLSCGHDAPPPRANRERDYF